MAGASGGASTPHKKKDKPKKKHKKSDKVGESYQTSIPGTTEKPAYEPSASKQHKRNAESTPANLFKNKNATLKPKPIAKIKKKNAKVVAGDTTINKAELSGVLKAHLDKATAAFEDVGGGVQYQKEALQIVSEPKREYHPPTHIDVRPHTDDGFDRLEAGPRDGGSDDVSSIVDEISQGVHEPRNFLSRRSLGQTFRFSSRIDAHSGEAFLIVGGALSLFFAIAIIGIYLIVTSNSAIGICFLICDLVMAATLYKCAVNGTYWM